ncbi:hypothetical protein RAS2_27900 [Phycisphaerae bacterium RAS2]|nr:hypothetical protein RAS2_27900 [Phycisphaerae bacterium RAS2]
MGQHRTSRSVAAIEAIESFGSSLGYRVIREWDIPGTQPHSEQIDLAFFTDEKTELPVFAVEVDSADVPASMSNAMKIFGKPTRDWVKPTFVFHVFLDVTEDDRRRMNAEGAFSTQNYRTYDFGHQREAFLTDLIDQSRSIKSEIDLIELARALDDETWDPVDRYFVLNHAGRLAHPTLTAIAAITISTSHMREALSRAVVSDGLEDMQNGPISFAGRMFSWPLVLGLRAHHAPTRAAETFKLFRRWQEDPKCIIFNAEHTMLGLSQDFDFAIVELAPPVFYFMTMLFRRERAAAKTLCEQLLTRVTDGSLCGVWERYGLLWSAAASVGANEDDIAQRAIDRINVLGGLPPSVLSVVPSPMKSEDDDADWESVLEASAPASVSLPLVKQAQASLQAGDETPDELISELFVNDDILPELNLRVLHLRWL